MSRADVYLEDYKWSPSQISTSLACERKWGWTYLMQMRGESSPGQALGTRVHRVLEEYAQGLPIDTTTGEGRIAIEAVPHIPEPPFPYESEFHVYGRHHWSGRKDVELEDEVIDYKTTSDFKWAKTTEQLQSDPQAIVYAQDYFDKHPDKNEVQESWIYLCTRRPGGKKVSLRVLRDETQAKFELLEQQADKMTAHLRAAEGLDDEATRHYIAAMPYNGSHCEAYGGCQFRGLCNLSPSERFASAMNQAQDSILAQIQKIQINPPAKAIPPEPPTQPETPSSKSSAAPVVAGTLEQPKPTEATALPVGETVHVAVPVHQEPRIGTLYVGCVPMGYQGIFFEDIVAKAKRMVREKFELGDYRFADYGRGPGLLLAGVMNNLDDAGAVAELVVDQASPEWAICAADVRARSNRIIVGLR